MYLFNLLGIVPYKVVFSVISIALKYNASILCMFFWTFSLLNLWSESFYAVVILFHTRKDVRNLEFKTLIQHQVFSETSMKWIFLFCIYTLYSACPVYSKQWNFLKYFSSSKNCVKMEGLLQLYGVFTLKQDAYSALLHFFHALHSYIQFVLHIVPKESFSNYCL